jgi:hypothetical protein
MARATASTPRGPAAERSPKPPSEVADRQNHDQGDNQSIHDVLLFSWPETGFRTRIWDLFANRRLNTIRVIGEALTTLLIKAKKPQIGRW